MAVGRLEHLAFPGSQPRGLRRTVTFGAAAVSAGVVRLDLVLTVVALGDMAAQGGRATQRNGTQGSVLHARQGRPGACEEGRTMLAHHIGHFEWSASHGSLSGGAGEARASRGLSVACSAGWATWR